MSNVNKSFLDLQGLQEYDSKIKEFFLENESKPQVTSTGVLLLKESAEVNDETGTLII